MFRLRDGEDIGPIDRPTDLRGDVIRCVFRGDVPRGGRLFLALLTRAAGPGKVPTVTWTISKMGSALNLRERLTLVDVHTVVSGVCVVWRYAIGLV